MDMHLPKRTSKIVIVLVLITITAGCMGNPDIDAENPSTTQTTIETQIHAQGEIREIIDDSDRVDEILAGKTYSYEKGKYEKSEERAVAIIRTGGDSEEENAQLYKIQIDLAEETVTDITPVNEIQITTT